MKEFGVFGHEKAETILLFASALYIVLSIAFMAWMTQLTFRLPVTLQRGVNNMLFGWGKTIETSIGQVVNGIRGRR